jgi:hypothetical protein
MCHPENIFYLFILLKFRGREGLIEPKFSSLGELSNAIVDMEK